jgi:large subunit ribosomal protein L10
MPKTKAQKTADLATLVDQSKRAKSVVFGFYRGLAVKEIEDLRKQCRAANIDYVVPKKTLLELAFKDAGITGVDMGSFDKPVAVAFSYEDEIAPAKLLAAFAKKHESLQIAGGVLEHGFVSASQVVALSQLPSREDLLAKVLGSLNAPTSGFVSVLAGTMRKFLYALNAIQESKA